MINGLYSGAAALNVLAKQQELISHNLANLNTAGFRSAQFAVDQRVIPNSPRFFGDHGPKEAEKVIDFSQGRHERTGRALDVAISGDAFFVLDGPNGELFSRSGQFFRETGSGNLVNESGFAVRGTNGPIQIPENVSDTDLAIAADGTISANAQTLGQLELVSFEDNGTLVGLTQSIFEAGEDSQKSESAASVMQFHQELSNGHPVNELINMISGIRQYEAVQKITSTISETLREHIRA